MHAVMATLRVMEHRYHHSTAPRQLSRRTVGADGVGIANNNIPLKGSSAFLYFPFPLEVPYDADSRVVTSHRNILIVITGHQRDPKGNIIRGPRTLPLTHRLGLPRNIHPARTVAVTVAARSAAALFRRAGESEVVSKTHSGTPKATMAGASPSRPKMSTRHMPLLFSLQAAMLGHHRIRAMSQRQRARTLIGPPRICKSRTRARRIRPKRTKCHLPAGRLQPDRSPRRRTSSALV